MASVALSDLLRSAAEDANTDGRDAGGYPEDIFENLSETEKDRYECGICYMVVRLAKECRNGHVFCSSCILTWAVTNRAGSDKCPVCRSQGIYGRNKEIDNRLALKRVQCNVEGCNWKGLLANFKFHKASHERKETFSDIPPMPAISLSPRSSPRGSPLFSRSPVIFTSSPRLPDIGPENNRQSPLLDRSSPLAFYFDRRNSPRRSVINTQVRDSRKKVKSLLENFDKRLTQRKRNIDEFHRERENARLEQLQEVHMLESRLEEVSADLTHLMDDMAHDNDRYRAYIRTNNSMLSQLGRRVSPRSNASPWSNEKRQ